ncbi:TPA: O-antigen ligase, partial [Klebsiella pneumoniae subsp. pneumoniae]|nr:O-antigen ligase [Klebsiella pneumoniae subsp. pneumoniae]
LCYIRTYVYSTRYVILYLLVFISVLLSIVVYFTYGELIELYQNILRSLSLNDSSSLVRLRILRVMQNNFIDNFLLGNGYLSNQADINMGDTKFSPLDIGVLGVIY